MTDHPLDDEVLLALRRARPSGEGHDWSPHSAEAQRLLSRITSTLPSATALSEERARQGMTHASMHPRVSRTLVLATVVAAAGIVTGVSVVPWVNRPAESRPILLTAAKIRSIAAASTAAIADSGTAHATVVGTFASCPSPIDACVNLPQSTYDIVFAQQNLAAVISRPGQPQTQTRFIDGHLYMYDGQQWYEAPNAAPAGIPDPRTLLQTLAPGAAFVNLGQEEVGGVRLTHLHATEPAKVDVAALSRFLVGPGGSVRALDVWVDAQSVVRRIDVTVAQTWQVPSPRNAPVAYPPVTLTGITSVSVTFSNLGAPETIAIPPNPIQVG